MKHFIFLLAILCTSTIISQGNTEVYLFDIIKKGETTTLGNQRNISNNEGYDNQPFFFDDNTILSSATRNDQTDIAAYHITDNKVGWLTNTSGSEYSPTRIPGQMEVSAIRLDKDGTQLLYRYNYKTGGSKVLLKDLKVGYHTWFNQEILVSSVLEDESLSLVVSNLKDNKNTTFQKKTGRSLHKIPNTNLIGYINKEDATWEIKSLDPISGATEKIINTISGSEDMCWLPDGTILMGKGDRIFKYNPRTDKRWNTFHSFIDKEIGNITRIATNAAGSMLAIVSDISPEHIVQQQVEAYNKRNIDAFLETYTENVVIYKSLDSIRSKGKEAMRPRYEKKFKDEPNLFCEIKKRMVYQNKVIDEEFVTYSDRNVSVAAIYEIQNGKIDKVTFIRPGKGKNTDPEKIVQEQLDAYNTRNIDAFADTYADGIKVYKFPDTFLYEGKEKLKEQYKGFFAKTPDLHCEIKNRIIMGNKVIDEEYLTINGQNQSAIAIYEVTDGKISKVTFL